MPFEARSGNYASPCSISHAICVGGMEGTGYKGLTIDVVATSNQQIRNALFAVETRRR